MPTERRQVAPAPRKLDDLRSVLARIAKSEEKAKVKTDPPSIPEAGLGASAENRRDVSAEAGQRPGALPPHVPHSAARDRAQTSGDVHHPPEKKSPEILKKEPKTSQNTLDLKHALRSVLPQGAPPIEVKAAALPPFVPKEVPTPPPSEQPEPRKEEITPAQLEKMLSLSKHDRPPVNGDRV